MNSHKYHLKIIPGTNQFVIDELIAKFPQTIINHQANDRIEFSSTINDILEFENIHSAISITNSDKFNINLHKKSWRIKTLPASTHPSLAYILCQIAKLKPTDTIYDPFCGCGTIPITAIKLFNIKQAFASDLSGKAIDFCQINSEKAHISNKKLIIFRSNISMTKLAPSSINSIISNLPFGIRTGNHEKNIKLYKILSHKCQSMLHINGVGIFLTQEKKLFLETFSPIFQVKKITTVDIGGLTPDIYKIKKIS